jgi:hypothetical protein
MDLIRKYLIALRRMRDVRCDDNFLAGLVPLVGQKLSDGLNAADARVYS